MHHGKMNEVQYYDYNHDGIDQTMHCCHGFWNKGILSDWTDLGSVMRCLGIPARSVTNFSSAHDTDGNLTIDVYINQRGEWLDDMAADSIWSEILTNLATNTQSVNYVKKYVYSQN